MTHINPYILSPDERVAAWRLGTYLKFADAGIPASRINDVYKAAAIGTSPVLSPSGLAKMVVTVAALTGVPIGIAAHAVDRHIRNSRGKEKELELQTDYFRNAAQQLEAGLA